jgi:hypothetical protein
MQVRQLQNIQMPCLYCYGELLEIQYDKSESLNYIPIWSVGMALHYCTVYCFPQAETDMLQCKEMDIALVWASVGSMNA